MRKNAFVALLWLLPFPALAQDWFPLTLPWSDDTKTVIDASGLLVDYPGQDPATVIDARGHVRVGPDGHFVFEKTGKRTRFWGVNFTFNASFPPCPDVPRAYEPADPQSAEKVARRLAKLGVNIVRFHHMDFYASPNGIFDPQYFPNDTQHLDAAQLRRFDYLLYQLRLNGIYANINLKVARHFGPGDGLEDTQKFTDSLAFFQGVSHYNQRMIELQKDYARQLLTHCNPYTGLRYVDDPGVMCIEIANEDSLFGNMLGDGGLNYLPGVSGSMPDRYSRELDELWNQWLRDRYSSLAVLTAAWAPTGPPVDSHDRARNGDFTSGMAEWWVGPVGGSAQASAAVVAGVGPDASAALRVQVVSDGTNWHVQGTQTGHSIEKDHTYEIRFYARSDPAGDLTLDMMKGADPWSNYGLSKTFRIGQTWQQYSAAFRANATDDQFARITFELGASPSKTIWIDKVEFRETGLKGLEAGESLDQASVRRPVRSELGGFTPNRILDLFRFYSELDESYFSGMRQYLKTELGLKSLVTGTAPWWAYLGDTAIQSKLDFVDGHFYWDHPWWPNVPAWSSTGWVISNQPLINRLDELSSLAAQAVEGKPFTVSEFNQPFPNQYAHEAPLLIALIGNLQDWDAIYMFDYTGNAANYADNYVHTGSYFSMAGNPVKTAQLAIAARLFIGRQSEPASARLNVELNPDELALAYSSGLYNSAAFLESKGLDRPNFLEKKLRITTFNRSTPATLNYPVAAGNVSSSHGELVWNRENQNSKFARIEGGGVEGGIGFLKGRTHQFPAWSFSVTGGPDHLALLLQSRDPVPLRESRRLLLSVWTEEQNTGMTWNAEHTTLENRWGGPPTLVRGAKADIVLTLAGSGTPHLYPLDERGNRKPELTRAAGPGIRYAIDTARDQTVWYEVVQGEETATVDFTLGSADSLFQMYTDASGADLQLGWFRMSRDQGKAVSVLPLLEYRNNGVTTSMVRLPATAGATLWKVPVTRDNILDTAVAVLNERGEAASVSMRLLDASGTPVGDARLENLDKGQTKAFYIQERFSIDSPFDGSLELSGPTPFVAMSLRSATNAKGDIFLTPLPAAVPSTTGPLYFAHLASDPAYSTEILLLNSNPQPATVRLEFHGGPGAPLEGGPSRELTFQPSELKRIRLERPSDGFYGYLKVTSVGGTTLPAIMAVITLWQSGSPVSEVGIPASAAETTQQFVAVERPTRHSALALLNTSASTATVELQWTSEENPAGNRSTAVNLAPGEKKSAFLFELFEGFPRIGSGILRISSSAEVATLSLLGTYNERGDFLLTALPAGDRLDSQPDFAVPRMLTGAGYRTLLFVSAAEEGGSSGTVQVFDAQGQPMTISFR